MIDDKLIPKEIRKKISDFISNYCDFEKEALDDDSILKQRHFKYAFELIVENDLLTHEQIRFFLLKDYSVLIPDDYIIKNK